MERIVFDEDVKTFRLYFGDSLYSFCISPELTLEHLYWGKKLQDEFDLRYLSQSSRMVPFMSSEEPKRANPICSNNDSSNNNGNGNNHHQSNANNNNNENDNNSTLEAFSASWRNSNISSFGVNFKESERIKKKRLENLKWRLVAIKLFQQQQQQQHAEQQQQTERQELIGTNNNDPNYTYQHRSHGLKIDTTLANNRRHQQINNNNNTNNKSRVSQSVPTTPTSRQQLEHKQKLQQQKDQQQPLQQQQQQQQQSQPHRRFTHATMSPVGVNPLPFSSNNNNDNSNTLIPSLNLMSVQGSAAVAAATTTTRTTTTATAVSTPRQRLPTALFNVTPELKSKQQTSLGFDRLIGKLGKGALCCEYSDHGTGDFRTPSFLVIDATNGSSISPLRYKCHTIVNGKVPLPYPWPQIRINNNNNNSNNNNSNNSCSNSGGSDATTLVVTMVDAGSGLEVDLVYVAVHNYDVLLRRTVFRNNKQQPQPPQQVPSTMKSTDQQQQQQQQQQQYRKVIQKASSMTIDFESTSIPFHLTQLSGSWARERFVVETKLQQQQNGTTSFGSTRGVSSHQHNPFAAITIGQPSETTGEVKGFVLLYSGNFLFESELSEMGRLRVNLGINPLGFQWHLLPQQQFFTPEVVMVRSEQGMGGMSRILHQLFLHCLLPQPTEQQQQQGEIAWFNKVPPILLNTWEAKYFNINHNSVVDMARRAVSLGIDLLVVDDGWFAERNNDNSSLGDWFASPKKFPLGLSSLVGEVNECGCRFGLWLEPEMVSEDSLLYRQHPDWCLLVPNRQRQIGRNQFVLDLSRAAVVEHLFVTISNILNSANIEYIKWDCNRPLTEVFSQRDNDEEDEKDEDGNNNNNNNNGGRRHRSSICQSETSHRYVLGLYDLQHRLTDAFPNVLLENCSSGGGRMDGGMLYFGSQVWCSDNTDAITRMKIQFGSSLVFPARCVGSHVSSVPNHITGNYTRSRTRGLVAMCGTYGFELDLSEMKAVDEEIFKQQILVFRHIVAPVVHHGDLFRLWDPFKLNLAAWMYVSRDKLSAIVFAFSMNSDHWSNLVPRLLLQGLLENVVYEITEPLPNNITQASGNLRIIESEKPFYQLNFSSFFLTGRILMNAGLPIKFYTLDDSIMFCLKAKDTGNSSGDGDGDGDGGGKVGESGSVNNNNNNNNVNANNNVANRAKFVCCQDENEDLSPLYF